MSSTSMCRFAKQQNTEETDKNFIDELPVSHNRSTQQPHPPEKEILHQHFSTNSTWHSRTSRQSKSQKQLVDRDRKMHVGGGNIISYRWVTLAPPSEPKLDGTVLEATGALKVSQNAMGLEPLAFPQQAAFLIIVMPDLFMTMDSMEKDLGGILEHNSGGRLLLVRKTRTCEESTQYNIHSDRVF